jgi:hypothetical protein
MTAPYEEQFERVKRYLSKFEEINDGKIHDQSSSHYDDDVYAFFQACYHLKDWIRNDPACSSWSNVEDYINNNPKLQICGDLCNALKHLVLDRHRSTENPNFAGSGITLSIENGFGVDKEFYISIKYIISTNSGTIDAFALAEDCVKAWETFIQSNTKTP